MAPLTWSRAIRRPSTTPYTTHLHLVCLRDQVHDHMVRSCCICKSPINSFIRRVTGANTDDGKKDRRRKEIVGRLGKEMNDRRDECVSSFCSSLIPPAFKQGAACVPSGRQYTESISALHSVAMQLAARPETLPSYTLRLYPLSIERSALLAQLAVEERNSLESAEAAYELERERVEEEWKRGRDRIRERLLEGIEERRRRARDEKDGEGTVSGTWAFYSYLGGPHR